MNASKMSLRSKSSYKELRVNRNHPDYQTRTTMVNESPFEHGPLDQRSSEINSTLVKERLFQDDPNYSKMTQNRSALNNISKTTMM